MFLWLIAGTGKGGKSIYATPNSKFADEIRDTLKHSKRGTVSMARLLTCPADALGTTTAQSSLQILSPRQDDFVVLMT